MMNLTARQKDKAMDILILAGIILAYLTAIILFLVTTFIGQEYINEFAPAVTIPVFATAVAFGTAKLVKRLED